MQHAARKKVMATLLVGGLLLLALPALAQPAPWHKWRSKNNGVEVCAQTRPGPGWVHARGPYRDLNCTQPGRPGDPVSRPEPRPAN